jgi:hypothetical protein
MASLKMDNGQWTMDNEKNNHYPLSIIHYPLNVGQVGVVADVGQLLAQVRARREIVPLSK